MNRFHSILFLFLIGIMTSSCHKNQLPGRNSSDPKDGIIRVDEKEECKKAEEAAKSEARKGRYYYIKLGLIKLTEFGRFHWNYVEEKYNVKISSCCTLGDRGMCFQSAANSEVNKKFGDDFLERTRKEAEVLFENK